MRKIFVGVLALLLSGCASSLMTTITRTNDEDIKAAIAINQDSHDTMGLTCVAWIGGMRPEVLRVLDAKTSGPLSVIAKRRAIELLYAKLHPEFERACGPVLMDERGRLIRFAAMFGR